MREGRAQEEKEGREGQTKGRRREGRADQGEKEGGSNCISPLRQMENTFQCQLLGCVLYTRLHIVEYVAKQPTINSHAQPQWGFTAILSHHATSSHV